MVGRSGWVAAFVGSEVASVISEGIVGSSELSSAKDLRLSSEAGCEILGLEKREDCALVGLLDVEGDMNGLSSMSA